MTRLRESLTCILLIYFVNFTFCHVILVSDLDDILKSEEDPSIPVSTNKVSLVKRIIPHNYKTPEFEYDRKYKTIFAPKYRVHKRRPSQNEKDSVALYKLLFRPIKVPRKRNPINAILKLAAKQNGRNILRVVYDEAGVQGRPNMVNVYNDDATDKGKKSYNFPHFSYLNYWTYDKLLLHDQCPRNQAKIGHRCVYAPHIVT